MNTTNKDALSLFDKATLRAKNSTRIGDRISVLREDGKKTTFTLSDWDGDFMVSKTGISDHSALHVYAVNGRSVDFSFGEEDRKPELSSYLHSERLFYNDKPIYLDNRLKHLPYNSDWYYLDGNPIYCEYLSKYWFYWGDKIFDIRELRLICKDLLDENYIHSDINEEGEGHPNDSNIGFLLKNNIAEIVDYFFELDAIGKLDEVLERILEPAYYTFTNIRTI